MAYTYVDDQIFNYLQPFDKSPLWSSEYDKLHFYYLFLNVASDDILDKFRLSDCLKLWNMHCWKLYKKNRNAEN